MEENKNREERTEQETKQTKEDIIIEKLNNIQIQNGIIMSTIGEAVFILLDKRKELNLNRGHVASLDGCISSISTALGKIETDTGMCTEEEFNRQNDEVAKEIVEAIVGLFK